MRLGAGHTQTPSLWPTGPRRSLHTLPRFSSTLTLGCRELTIRLLSSVCAGHRAHGFVCTVSFVLTNEAYYPISWMGSLRLRGMLLCARASGKCRRLVPQPSLHSTVLPRLHLRLHEPSIPVCLMFPKPLLPFPAAWNGLLPPLGSSSRERLISFQGQFRSGSCQKPSLASLSLVQSLIYHLLRVRCSLPLPTGPPTLYKSSLHP